jgi:hypothetical protein
VAWRSDAEQLDFWGIRRQQRREAPDRTPKEEPEGSVRENFGQRTSPIVFMTTGDLIAKVSVLIAATINKI